MKVAHSEPPPYMLHHYKVCRKVSLSILPPDVSHFEEGLKCGGPIAERKRPHNLMNKMIKRFRIAFLYEG